MKRLAEQLAGCHPDWRERWSISFFSDARFAGYKDEPEVLPRVKDGTWGHGYLAEYDNRSGILVLFPLLPDRRLERVIRNVTGSFERSGVGQSGQAALGSSRHETTCGMRDLDRRYARGVLHFLSSG